MLRRAAAYPALTPSLEYFMCKSSDSACIPSGSPLEVFSLPLPVSSELFGASELPSVCVIWTLFDVTARLPQSSEAEVIDGL